MWISDLGECKFIERISLFKLLVDINGMVHEAYINNTGRLADLLVKGKTCYYTHTKSRKSKLKYRVIGIEDGELAAVIDTKLQEEAFIKLCEQDSIPWLSECKIIKRNHRLNNEVIDFLVKQNGKNILVELKSAVMKLPGNNAGYPDAPTPRGRRQIRLLAEYTDKGYDALVVFIAGIPRARGFKLNHEVDGGIASAVEYALKRNVSFKAINIYLDPNNQSIILGNSDLPVDLNP